MNRPFYSKFAWTNIIGNKRVYIPFILSAALMFALLYDLLALVYYPGMADVYGGMEMVLILRFGASVTALFLTIFLFYTNNYVIRERKQSIGLYAILGMNRRNITTVIFIETAIVFCASTALGLLFGMAMLKLLFALYLRVNAVALSPIGLFSQQSFVYVGALALLNMIIAFVVNVFKVNTNHPLQLLNDSKMSDKPLKANVIMGIIGLVTLGSGYYLAQSIVNPLSAISLFFIAVVLVIVGTFIAMRSTLTWLFMQLKKNKKLYYHHRRFIALSGIVHRIAQNANGLASICILSTAVLVTLATTGALYVGVDDSFSRQRMYDYDIVLMTDAQLPLAEIRAIEDKIDDRIHRSYRVQDVRSYSIKLSFLSLDGNRFGETEEMLDAKTVPVILMTRQDYNRLNAKQLALSADVHVVTTGDTDIAKHETIVLLDDTLRATYSTGIAIPRNKFYELYDTTYTIVLKDYAALSAFTQQLTQTKELIYHNIEFDSSGDWRQTLTDMRAFTGDLETEHVELNVTGREDMKSGLFGIYSGLLFIGMIIGSLFLIATGLVIYYKQVSEGFQDRRRFTILTQVGMKDSEVKKTINTQVIMLFFIPIVMAAIHLLFAFKMISLLLRVLGLTNAHILLLSLAVCFVLFVVVYYIFYQFSSRAYYRIVNDI